MMYNIFSHNYLRRMVFFGLVLLIIAGGMGLSTNEAKAAAGVSKILSYQGRLTDISGNPLGGAGTNYCFRFSIYTAASGGTKVWPAAATPSTMTVSVIEGIFSVGIGDTGAGGDDLANSNWNASYPNGFADIDTTYLNIDVATIVGATCALGDGAESFEPLAPRQRIDATAYARVAENVFGGEVRVGTGGGVSAGSQKYLKLDVVTVSEALGGAGSCTNLSSSMWFNTGNNAPLICTTNAIQQVLTTANVVTAAQGGTGQSSYAIGDLLYASGATTLSKLADVAAGRVFVSGGVGVAPSYSATPTLGVAGTTLGTLSLAGNTSGVITIQPQAAAGTYNFNLPTGAGTAGQPLLSGGGGAAAMTFGTLGVAAGGTGLATLTTGNVILGAGTGNVTFVSPATSGNVLTANGTTWVSQAPSGGGAPTTATYITQTADATLSAEQALSALATGYMKVTTTTGAVTSQVVPIPVADGGTGLTTPGTAGNLLQSNGTAWTSAAPPAASGLPKYNQSVTTPAAGFAVDTYLVGSSITIPAPATTLKVGSRYHLIFNVSKTAFGAATPIINIRYGTLGTTGDASKCALTWTAQTAATDTGTFEIWATFRTIGSGTTAVLQCAGQRRHGASVTGLGTLVAETKVATSAGFDSTVVNSILGASVNGGASAVWTITNVNTTLENIN